MKSLLSLSLDGERTSEILSRDLPFLPWATDYLWILIGAGITVLVQSSSVITSGLVPLVSSKVITLERAYPITLGANLGTTATSIIAALSFNGGRTAFRLSLCHFFSCICFYFSLSICLSRFKSHFSQFKCFHSFRRFAKS